MISFFHAKRHALPCRCISLFIIFTFMLSLAVPPQARAQSLPGTILNLPIPGSMVGVSGGYVPALVKGIRINPENPLSFNFIVDTGESGLEGVSLNEEAEKLIKYFLASLTVPEKEMWVNLSPYEKDRIIPDSLGVTELGRDLLAQDYLLKQLTASLIYPENELGNKFWQKVYERVKVYAQDIPASGGRNPDYYNHMLENVGTFNKIWIVPDKAVVYEHDGGAYVLDSHLKVMLEEDYVAREALFVSREAQNRDTRYEIRDTNDHGSTMSDVVREVLIPAIEEEINTGKNFANLRQIYNSMILAVWYKMNLQASLLGQVYVDKNKTKGIDVEDREVKQKIYEQYLEAFKVGVYDYIKEEYDPTVKQVIPRKYFSGGAVGINPEIVETVKGPQGLEGRNDRSELLASALPRGNILDITTTLVENAQEGDVAPVYGGDRSEITQNPQIENLRKRIHDALADYKHLSHNVQYYVDRFMIDGGYAYPEAKHRAKTLVGRLKLDETVNHERLNELGKRDLDRIENEASIKWYGIDARGIDKEVYDELRSRRGNFSKGQAVLIVKNAKVLFGIFSPDEEETTYTDKFFEDADFAQLAKESIWIDIKTVQPSKKSGQGDRSEAGLERLDKELEVRSFLEVVQRHGLTGFKNAQAAVALNNLHPKARVLTRDRKTLTKEEAIGLLRKDGGVRAVYMLSDGNALADFTQGNGLDRSEAAQGFRQSAPHLVSTLIKAVSGTPLNDREFNMLVSDLLSRPDQVVWGVNKENAPAEVSARLAAFQRSYANVKRVWEAMGITDSFEDQLWYSYLPLAEWLKARKQEKRPDEAFVFGINGSQGNGKTVMASVLQAVLNSGRAGQTVAISIDDFYKTKAERERMKAVGYDAGEGVSNRGPAGTHETGWMKNMLEALRTSTNDTRMNIPKFNKGADDREPANKWETVNGKVDFVILEGWFVGADTDFNLNRIPEGFARTVAKSLQDDYKPIFDMLDDLLVFDFPSIDQIEKNRIEQEVLRRAQDPGQPGMTDEEIKRFVKYFYSSSWTEDVTSPVPSMLSTSLRVQTGSNRRITQVDQGGRAQDSVTQDSHARVLVRPDEYVQVVAGAKLISRRVKNPKAKVIVIEPISRKGIDRMRSREDLDYDILHVDSELYAQEDGSYRSLTQEQLEQIVKNGQYDIIVPFVNFKINKDVIDASKNLKAIISFATGYNNIDVAYANSKNIVVTNAPGPLTIAMGELNMGMMLAAKYNIHEAVVSLKPGESREGFERIEDLAVDDTEAPVQLYWGELLRRVLRLDDMIQLVLDKMFGKCGVGENATVLHNQLGQDESIGVQTSLGIIGPYLNDQYAIQRFFDYAVAHEVATVYYSEESAGEYVRYLQARNLTGRTKFIYLPAEKVIEKSSYTIITPGADIAVEPKDTIVDTRVLAINRDEAYRLNESLMGQTFSIAGLGRIGQAAAKRAIALGMKIAAFEKFPNEGVRKELTELYRNTITSIVGREDAVSEEELAGAVQYVSKEELFRRADVITYLTTLTDETRYFVDAEHLAMIENPKVIHLSTSRGPVVNEKAMIAYLKEHPEATLFADVLEDETKNTFLGLAELPNAFVTGHTGSAVVEVRDGMVIVMVEDNLFRVIDGRVAKNQVPESTASPIVRAFYAGDAQGASYFEQLTAAEYWRGRLTTTPVKGPFRASRQEDVVDIARLEEDALTDPEKAAELNFYEQLAIRFLLDGKGYISMLAGGASSRMNTAEAPSDVRGMVEGREILSKAAVPIGKIDGRVITYLDIFGINFARMIESIKEEAERQGLDTSRLQENTVGLLSNDDYRPEHEAILAANNHYGLPVDMFSFFHQPLGAKFFATPDDVKKLKAKFKGDDFRKALEHSESVGRRFKQGDVASTIVSGERDPIGHGEYFHQMVASGELLKIIDAGKEAIFVKNVDNYAAKFDKTWLRALGLFLHRGLDVQPEVSPRSPGQKGGSLIVMADGSQQLAEDPNIVASKTNVKPGDSYWFNDAVAFVSPRFVMSIYKQDGQADEAFIAELRRATPDELQAIADRGRRKFPKILDVKPGKRMVAGVVKPETNMWQATGVGKGNIQAIGVRGARNFPVNNYSQMSVDEREQALANLRFLSTKQWSLTQQEVNKAREALQAQLGREVTDEELWLTLETYEGNKLLSDDMLRYILEAELVTPGILAEGANVKAPKADVVDKSAVSSAQESFPAAEVLVGRVVALQGIGGVGGLLIKPLLDSGAIVVAADINAEALDRLRQDHHDAVSRGSLFTILETRQEDGTYTDKIFSIPQQFPDELTLRYVDIFIPAAKGPVINPRTIAALKAMGVDLVIGPANYMLEDTERDAEGLEEAGIAFVPDYVANAGGVLGVNGHLGHATQDAAIRQARAAKVRELIGVHTKSNRTIQKIADDEATLFIERLQRADKLSNSEAKEDLDEFKAKLNGDLLNVLQLEKSRLNRSNPKRISGVQLSDGTQVKVMSEQDELPSEISHFWDNHYAVFELTNDMLGYTAYVAIHRLTKIASRVEVLNGQYRATGGTRILHYASNDEALADALELSREMSFKNAGAGLSIGGSKGVINVTIDPKSEGGDQDKRQQILISYAKSIELIGSLIGGGVLTGQDINISVQDADMMAQHAPTSIVPNVAAGLSRAPTMPTAVGIWGALVEAAGEVFSKHVPVSKVDRFIDGTENPFWVDMRERLTDIRPVIDPVDPDIINELSTPLYVVEGWADDLFNDEEGVSVYHSRVVSSNVLGPAKGGIRWLSAANLMKSPGFEEAFSEFNRLRPTLAQVKKFIANWVRQESQPLALGMTFKNAANGLPLGGGKGAVFIGRIVKNGERWELKNYRGDQTEIARLDNEVKAKVARRHALELARRSKIGHLVDIPAPDMNTNSQTMAWYQDEFIRYLVENTDEIKENDPELYGILQTISKTINRYKVTDTPFLSKMTHVWFQRQKNGNKSPMPWLGVFTGKAVRSGGAKGRLEATGEGGGDVTAEYLKSVGQDVSGRTFAIHGFGNVGSFYAIRVARDGGIVKAISDISGAYLKEEGFSLMELQQLQTALTESKLTLREAFEQNLIEDNGIEKIEGDSRNKEDSRRMTNAVLSADVDILVPAAMEGTINPSNADLVKAPVIIEMANGPVTPEAEEKLLAKGITIIPDTIANAGGVTVSWVETSQVLDGRQKEEDEVAAIRRGILKNSVGSVAEARAAFAGVSLRQAADITAILKILEKKHGPEEVKRRVNAPDRSEVPQEQSKLVQGLLADLTSGKGLVFFDQDGVANLARMVEGVQRLAEAYGVDRQQLERLRQKRFEAMGGFSRGLFLIDENGVAQNRLIRDKSDETRKQKGIAFNVKLLEGLAYKNALKAKLQEELDDVVKTVEAVADTTIDDARRSELTAQMITFLINFWETTRTIYQVVEKDSAAAREERTVRLKDGLSSLPLLGEAWMRAGSFMYRVWVDNGQGFIQRYNANRQQSLEPSKEVLLGTPYFVGRTVGDYRLKDDQALSSRHFTFKITQDALSRHFIDVRDLSVEPGTEFSWQIKAIGTSGIRDRSALSSLEKKFEDIEQMLNDFTFDVDGFRQIRKLAPKVLGTIWENNVSLGNVLARIKLLQQEFLRRLGGYTGYVLPEAGVDTLVRERIPDSLPRLLREGLRQVQGTEYQKLLLDLLKTKMNEQRRRAVRAEYVLEREDIETYADIFELLETVNQELNQSVRFENMDLELVAVSEKGRATSPLALIEQAWIQAGRATFRLWVDKGRYFFQRYSNVNGGALSGAVSLKPETSLLVGTRLPLKARVFMTPSNLNMADKHFSLTINEPVAGLHSFVVTDYSGITAMPKKGTTVIFDIPVERRPAVVSGSEVEGPVQTADTGKDGGDRSELLSMNFDDMLKSLSFNQATWNDLPAIEQRVIIEAAVRKVPGAGFFGLAKKDELFDQWGGYFTGVIVKNLDGTPDVLVRDDFVSRSGRSDLIVRQVTGEDYQKALLKVIEREMKNHAWEDEEQTNEEYFANILEILHAMHREMERMFNPDSQEKVDAPEVVITQKVAGEPMGVGVLTNDDQLAVVSSGRGKASGGDRSEVNPGGIDLNAEHLDLQIKRDGQGVPLPLWQQPVNMNIEGFLPVIINVTPVSSLPLLLGLGELPEEGAPKTDFGKELSPADRKARFEVGEPEKVSMLN